MSPATEPLSDVIGYGVLASRPTAGIAGRLYFTTDTGERFRDNGTSWDLVAGTANAGNAIGSWNYSRTRGGTPSDKGIRLSADITVGVANSFRIDDNDIAGADRGPYFGLIAVGDTIFVDDHAGNIARAICTAITDNGTWWEFTFTPSGAYPMALEPSNGSNVTFGWSSASGGGGSGVTVAEVDGSPSTAGITTLTFPNDSVSIAGSVATVRAVPTGFIGVRAYRSTTQAITTGQTAIGFDVDERDTDGIHDTVTNNSRFYVPAGMSGWWAFGGNVYFSGIGTSNWASLRVRLNGGATVYAATRVIGLPADAVLTEVHDVQYLTAGDYIELTVESDDTSYTVNTSGPTLPHFYMYKIDAGRAGSGIGCRAYNNGTQSIADATITPVTFGGEAFDTDGFHSTSATTSRFTIPAGLGGKYRFAGGTSWDSNTSGARYLWWRIDGTTEVDGGLVATSGPATLAMQTGVTLDLAAGQYVEMIVYQTSGGARTIGGTSADKKFESWVEVMRVDSGANTLYPPGYEYDYVENTGSGTVSATSAATAGTIITGSAVTYDGVTRVLIEMFFHRISVGAGSGAGVFLNLWDGSTDLGVIGMLRQNAATDTGAYGARRLTPSAGSHTYSIRAWRQVANGGWGGITGNDVPSFIRITKV